MSKFSFSGLGCGSIGFGIQAFRVEVLRSSLGFFGRGIFSPGWLRDVRGAQKTRHKPCKP